MGNKENLIFYSFHIFILVQIKDLKSELGLLKEKSLLKRITMFNRKEYTDAYNKAKYEERKEYNRLWYQKYKAKNKISVSYNREYLNKLSNKNYHKNKHKKRHTQAWRNMLKRTLTYQNVKKNSSTLNLLGFLSEQLKQRIEYQFTPKMNWENYGTYWEIDHKKAVASFDKNTPPNIVNALCNLQPLPKSINRQKSKNTWKSKNKFIY